LKPTKVIVHCAATPDTVNRSITADDVDRWHKERGWKGIGYQWFIRGDGTVEKGREEHDLGAHTKGQNEDSIGICYDGSYLPTVAQINAFTDLYRQIRQQWGIDYKSWFGHNDFANKDCPGFDMNSLIAILRKLP